MRDISSDRMRWFIVQLCVEKLQHFPNPNIRHTRTDTNTISMNIDLPQKIVNLAAALIAKTHVEFCIGVPK